MTLSVQSEVGQLRQVSFTGRAWSRPRLTPHVLRPPGHVTVRHCLAGAAALNQVVTIEPVTPDHGRPRGPPVDSAVVYFMPASEVRYEPSTGLR